MDGMADAPGGYYGAQQAEPTRPGVSELLSYEIDRYQSALDVLEKKISPALGPDYPSTEALKEAIDQSHLGAQVAQIAARNARLESLLRRIEL